MKNHHERRKKILRKLANRKVPRKEEEVKELLQSLDKVIEEELDALDKTGEEHGEEKSVDPSGDN